MVNILPQNGRIAIIDNEINEALPLIRVLSKNQLPYTFIKGDDVTYLPDSPSNDIRILFLDLNLLSSRTASLKEVKSILASTLKRVISTKNYPYTLIYWSKQEKEYASVVEELFEGELKNIAPIKLVPFIKSDFFPNFGEDEQETDKDIITELETILESMSSYSYILNWENQVHRSADATLQEIFRNYHQLNNWTNNADYIIKALGEAYLGKHYVDALPEDKIKGSHKAFNNIFIDTMELSIMKTSVLNPIELSPDETQIKKEIINADINARLNLSTDSHSICEPGVLFECDFEEPVIFGGILNQILAIFKIKSNIKINNPNIDDNVVNREVKEKTKTIKEDIKKTWKKIGVVVTPLCDYAQKKKALDRVVKGVLIEARYREFIDDKSDAIFISPTIRFNDKTYILIIDYRYFETLKLSEELKISESKYIALFRVRHQLLAEIQSKLSRHINRQGILFLQ